MIKIPEKEFDKVCKWVEPKKVIHKGEIYIVDGCKDGNMILVKECENNVHRTKQNHRART